MLSCAAGGTPSLLNVGGISERNNLSVQNTRISDNSDHIILVSPAAQPKLGFQGKLVKLHFHEGQFKNTKLAGLKEKIKNPRNRWNLNPRPPEYENAKSKVAFPKKSENESFNKKFSFCQQQQQP